MRILGVFLIVPVLYIESAKLTVYYKAIQYKKKIEFLIPEYRIYDIKEGFFFNGI